MPTRLTRQARATLILTRELVADAARRYSASCPVRYPPEYGVRSSTGQGLGSAVPGLDAGVGPAPIAGEHVVEPGLAREVTAEAGAAASAADADVDEDQGGGSCQPKT